MDQREFLVIVRRGQTDQFRFLEQSFAGEPIRLIWDRRAGERRRLSQPVSFNRRQSRRRRPSVMWDALGFAVAKAGTLAART